MSPPFLQLVTGKPARPHGTPLRAGDVPDDLLLRSASAHQRERLLIGLALSADHQSALHRVATECNALALQQTLELAAHAGSLGFIVEALGLDWLLALCVSRGVKVNDVLATTDTVAERGLTTREAQRIVENFGGTLDPSSIRLRFTTGVQTMGASALVLGNTIHVDPTEPRWKIRPGTTLPEDPHDEGWDSFNGVLLAHEPTHVWSYQHQGSRYAVNSIVDQVAAMQSGNRGGAYHYKPDRPHFLDYGEEQRAMIVQDFVGATRARAKGQRTSLTIYGGVLPVDDSIGALTRYLDQMRAMGPGMPQAQARSPEWILCACARGFEQDGGAGMWGRQADALIAGAGKLATQAVVDGLKKHDPLLVGAGAAGVGAAVAASLLPREQSRGGATSGGSALLDQAGIPRGVALDADGLELSAKAAWDAPLATPGAGDPRVEWGAALHRDVGTAHLDATVNAIIARSGEVRQADTSVRVEHGDASLAADAGVVPERGTQPLRAWAHVALVTDPVSLSAGAEVTAKKGVVQSLSAQSTLEVPRAKVSTEVQLSRHAADAPLALDEATLSASISPGAGTSLGVQAKLVPAGLEELAAQLATQGDAGSLSVTAAGTKLTTTPTAGVTVTATEKKSGVAVSAHAQVTPSTGAAEGGVSVSVPLPEPGKK